jgi:hypothetical protein
MTSKKPTAQVIKSEMPFIGISLPVLVNDEQYTVGLQIYDSLLGKRQSFMKIFNKSGAIYTDALQ